MRCHLTKKVVKCVKNKKKQILFPTLDLNLIKLVLYTDANFSNLPDGGNQGGHIIFLTQSHSKCCPLIRNSSKVKRVVHSTLTAEALTFNEGCETALYLSHIFCPKFSIWSTYQSPAWQITNCFMMSLTP